MVRHLQPIRGDTKAVVEVVGLVLMISIAVATATALHLSMTQTGTDKLYKIPMVNLKQTGDEIIVISVQYGPVVKEDVIINIIDDDGAIVCNGVVQSTGTYISSGDLISIPCSIKGTYTLQMIYSNSLIGMIEYSAH